jgi:hypothetical protein
MAILGALVAFGTKILAEHTVDTSKNFSKGLFVPSFLI